MYGRSGMSGMDGMFEYILALGITVFILLIVSILFCIALHIYCICFACIGCKFLNLQREKFNRMSSMMPQNFQPPPKLETKIDGRISKTEALQYDSCVFPNNNAELEMDPTQLSESSRYRKSPREFEHTKVPKNYNSNFDHVKSKQSTGLQPQQFVHPEHPHYPEMYQGRKQVISVYHGRMDPTQHYSAKHNPGQYYPNASESGSNLSAYSQAASKRPMTSLTTNTPMTSTTTIDGNSH